MKPITQTRTGIPSGNCTEACIASLLECRLEDVPDLYDPDDSDSFRTARFVELHRWLRLRGLIYAFAEIDPRPFPFNPRELFDDQMFDGYHLLGGPNPDGLEHMVVALNGVVVHDPNPLRRGITRVTGFGAIVPIRPEWDGWPSVGIYIEKLSDPAREERQQRMFRGAR